MNASEYKKIEKSFFERDKEKLTIGSKWVNVFSCGDVAGICITPDSEKKLFYIIKEVSKLFVKYTIQYDGNHIPNKIHRETIKSFIKDAKPL